MVAWRFHQSHRHLWSIVDRYSSTSLSILINWEDMASSSLPESLILGQCRGVISFLLSHWWCVLAGFYLDAITFGHYQFVSICIDLYQFVSINPSMTLGLRTASMAIFCWPSRGLVVLLVACSHHQWSLMVCGVRVPSSGSFDRCSTSISPGGPKVKEAGFVFGQKSVCCCHQISPLVGN